jgi:hypothetical protein
MRWITRGLISGLILVAVSSPAMAQSDVCLPGVQTYNSTERVEAMKIEAMERAEREAARKNWDVRMFSVKNEIPVSNLRALCIFRVEVVPQSLLKVVQVRAPKELMSAIEDAMKRLDVPPPVRKGVEVTAYVLVVADVQEPGLMPLPPQLDPVQKQLKDMLPRGNLYLADTMIARAADGLNVGINKGIGASDIVSLEARVTIRDGNVVRLDNLVVQARNAKFETNLDVPQGAQVVVGKGTSLNAKNNGVVILTMTARILD